MNFLMASTQPVSVNQAESEAQDEIEQIMNEIDALQSQMAEVDAAVSQKREAAAAAPAPAPAAAEAPEPAPEVAEVPEVAAAAEHLPMDAEPPVEASSDLPVAEIAEEHLPSEESVAGALAELEAVTQESATPPPAPPAPPRTSTRSAPAAPSPPPVARTQEVAEGEVAAQEAAILKDFEGQGEEPWLEETMAHLNSAQNERSLLEQEQEQSSGGGALGALDDEPSAAIPEAPPLARPHANPRMGALPPLQAPAASGAGAISLTVEGQMTLQLRYAADQYGVTITFSEQGLQLILQDGTEFKIPLRRAQGSQAA